MQIYRELPAIEKKISQQRIEHYAHASGDFNPVHMDAVFASKTIFGKTIAHGMMGLAFVSEMMIHTFKKDWLENGRLKIRFKAPLYPGDTVATFGRLKSVTENGDFKYVSYNVGCRNAKGEELMVGEASIKLAQYGTLL